MGKGNPTAKGLIGNRGGGRMGYTYEKDQLVKMRRMVDWMLGYMEAMRKGKVSDKGMEIFKTLLPPMMKAMDKLHANKQQVDIEHTYNPIPLLHVLHNNSNQENLQLKEADTGDPGGDVSG